MNIGGKEFPSEWLVQVKIEAWGDYIAYRQGNIAQVLEQDYGALDETDCYKYTLDNATLEIWTLPDCPSDEGDDGEYLGSMQAKLIDKDEPDPPKKSKDFTGCIETLDGAWSYHLKSIRCGFLNEISVHKQGLRIGPCFIALDDFDDQESDRDIGYLEWFIGGESIDPDNYCSFTGLLRDLWNDLDYIIDYTEKDVAVHGV